jgi:hypothetical protein
MGIFRQATTYCLSFKAISARWLRLSCLYAVTFMLAAQATAQVRIDAPRKTNHDIPLFNSGRSSVEANRARIVEARNGASHRGPKDSSHCLNPVEEGGTFRRGTTEATSRLSIARGDPPSSHASVVT